MTIIETIIFFLIIWWPIFFISLPLGFKSIANEEKNENFAKSAPSNPRILQKFIFTTLAAFLFTLLIWILAYFEVFSFKELII